MMKITVLPGKSIRVLNNYVLFYSVYNEDLISAFKDAKLKWDREKRVWYADLHDYQNTSDFLEKLSVVLSYFPHEETLYAAHFVNTFYSKLSNIIELSRRESSNFPVPLPEGLNLYPYQRAGVEFLVNKNNALLADSMGLGKEEWINNRVWTQEGRKRIGELQIGDKIFGPSGELVTVIGVYPQGRKKLYKVTFDDDCSVLVGLEHLWFVIDKDGNNHVLTTEQIMKKPDMNDLEIPITKPLQFPKKSKAFSTCLSPYSSGLIFSYEIFSYNFSANSYTCKSFKYRSIEEKISFLQGFLDGIKKIHIEGSEIHVCIPPLKVRRDITELVHSLGGLVTEIKREKKIDNKITKRNFSF